MDDSGATAPLREGQTMRTSRMLAAVSAILLTTVTWAGDYDKAVQAFQSADYDTALSIWQPLAEAGDAQSQFQLGHMYANGFGVMMEDASALKWYQMAADQGHGKAQCNLAVMHQNGWGVPQSEEEAMRYYRLAAEQGLVEAMQALGRHYAMDFSEEYDPVKAYKWYSIAAKFGDIDAKTHLDSVAEKMTAEQVADAQSQVEIWAAGHNALLASQ